MTDYTRKERAAINAAWSWLELMAEKSGHSESGMLEAAYLMDRASRGSHFSTKVVLMREAYEGLLARVQFSEGKERLCPGAVLAYCLGMRLDHNRAIAQLANKTGRPVSDITHMTIWGNHSATQYPDLFHAEVAGKNAAATVNDQAWLENDFIPTVAKRGAAIIAARGASSAASAANALTDHVRSLVTPGAIHSIAVKSNGAYGFDPAVWAGMPVRTTTPGSYEVITSYAMDDFAKSKIAATNKELVDERSFVADMIK